MNSKTFVTEPTILITPDGKHPARKWAELAAGEIVKISEETPETLRREAVKFRERLIEIFTKYHQIMMDQEQELIKAGKHGLDLAYDTEETAKQVRDEICAKLVENTSFIDHFKQKHVREWVEGICNKYFKSARMVERQHFHSENNKKD